MSHSAGFLCSQGQLWFGTHNSLLFKQELIIKQIRDKFVVLYICILENKFYSRLTFKFG